MSKDTKDDTSKALADYRRGYQEGHRAGYSKGLALGRLQGREAARAASVVEDGDTASNPDDNDDAEGTKQ